MIEYYRLPVRKGKISVDQHLKIGDESQLKDAIYNKSLEKAKVVSFKNSNIKDDTLNLFKTVNCNLLIQELDLSQNFSFITDSTVEILCNLENLPQLRKLNLADNHISDDSLVLLARCNWMLKLEELILYGNSDISGEGIVILAESPSIKHLKTLDLHATSVEDEGISYFLKSENSSHLENLNLCMSWKRITNKTLYSLGISKFCNKLKVLNLQDCQVGDIGLDELCESENSQCLESLNLNNSIKEVNNVITDKGLSSIAFSKYMTNLKTLELRHTDITPKGLKTLAVSLASQKLETIRLSHCSKLTDQSLHYLQKIVHYQSLKKLYLNETAIDREDLSSFELKNPQINLVY